jgi:carbon-monoxide dehydrogenase large subunit
LTAANNNGGVSGAKEGIMNRESRGENGPYIGRPMPRFEDLRLVRGAGRYSDDISMPGQAYAAFVRSPHAHAKVRRIDTAAARAMPGVIAVLTGADYVADGLEGGLQRAKPAGGIEG